MTNTEKFAKDLYMTYQEELYKVYTVNASIQIPEQNCRFGTEQTPAGDLIATMRQHVLRKTNYVTVDLGPRSAWQHIKRDWLPAWFSRLFPVELRQEMFEVNEIYPHYALSERDLGRGYVTVVRATMKKENE